MIGSEMNFDNAMFTSIMNGIDEEKLSLGQIIYAFLSD